jgi:hypothetical protein
MPTVATRLSRRSNATFDRLISRAWWRSYITYRLSLPNPARRVRRTATT